MHGFVLREVVLRFLSNIARIALSGGMLLWVLIEFSLQVRLHLRFAFSWQEVMLLQIFLSLSCSGRSRQSASASRCGGA